MLVLALDTTTRAGSVALGRDGDVVEAFVGDHLRPHAERLPLDIVRLLRRHGAAPSDVDVFAVATGPGSFTGLRIGIAAIQGLAFASSRPIVGVSALEALAHAVLGGRPAWPLRRVGVWMDAQRDEVFSAIYERVEGDGPAHLRTVDGPAVGEPRGVALRWHALAAGAWFPVAGDGAVRYRTVLEEVAGPAVQVIDPPLLAPSIAALAEARARVGETIPPHAIRPLYIRRPDAELARDRRQRGGQ
jgi:tRNA threonylcarbamoyladenosine biosynthesis protein TsaB